MKCKKSKISEHAQELHYVEKRLQFLTPEYVQIPTSLFRNRDIAVLESLVIYLHDKKKMRFREIGIMLNRDERTIYTAYTRAIKKIMKKQ